jgi:hypothetical protein
MKHRRPAAIPCLLLAGLMLGLGGCSGDEIAGPENDVLLLPSTPDDLVLAFAEVYGRMNLQDYGILLHADYEFRFAETSRDVPDWSRDLELASSENMFNGQPGEILDGQIACTGVDSIRVHELDRLTPWETLGPDDPEYPDTERALHYVNLVFHVDDGVNTFGIGTQQIFHVKGEEATRPDGTTYTGYTLRGQRELHPDKGNVDLYWGDIKLMFLPEGE